MDSDTSYSFASDIKGNKEIFYYESNYNKAYVNIFTNVHLRVNVGVMSSGWSYTGFAS